MLSTSFCAAVSLHERTAAAVGAVHGSATGSRTDRVWLIAKWPTPKALARCAGEQPAAPDDRQRRQWSLVDRQRRGVGLGRPGEWRPPAGVAGRAAHGRRRRRRQPAARLRAAADAAAAHRVAVSCSQGDGLCCAANGNLGSGHGRGTHSCYNFLDACKPDVCGKCHRSVACCRCSCRAPHCRARMFYSERAGS